VLATRDSTGAENRNDFAGGNGALELACACGHYRATGHAVADHQITFVVSLDEKNG
jgi:hypothetical protein